MTELQVGTKVVVRLDAHSIPIPERFGERGNWGFSVGMESFRGRFVTLAKRKDTGRGYYWMIEEDNGAHTWIDEWFEPEPVVEKKVDRFEVILGGI